MGFSVTISSTIVLIAMIAVSASLLGVVYQSLKEVSNLTNNYVCRERDKLHVSLSLTVDSVNATACNITVRNTGSKVIHLESQNGYNWNTIVLSYGNSTLWQSYPIEEYTVTTIRVSGTSYAFNLENHPFINPGEEASITFKIPNGAPEIPLNGLVSVVFVTHYGVAASGEGVRTG
ncbi:hypothetical protein H5T51_04575 [Candidatus Bathyarchaeota archaeon]|nr:hypothetical protein [Candidatus Bathyarchaeota archaeon]